MAVPAIAVFTMLAFAGRAPAVPDNPLTELLDAAARRLQLAEPVAAVKWRRDLAVADPQRVQQELDDLGAEATAANTDAAYVRDVFGDQIDATEAIEYSRFAQWKLDPGDAPTAAPELSDLRATIDELNHVMLDQIGLRWDLLHSPACLEQLDRARNDAKLTYQLDGLYRHALAVASQSYCRP